MPRDLADLAVSFAAMPAAIRDAEMVGVRKAAAHTTTAIRANIRAATGGDMRLSGVGRKGASVGARYEPKRVMGDAVEWVVRATGPLQLIERDTSPHVIWPRGSTFTGRGRRRAGAGALRVGDGFAAYADHPGTRGKHPFARGWKATRDDAPKLVQAELRKQMVGVFK